MVIFTQSMRELYAKNGIELPSKMSHKAFKFFLECHRKAFHGQS